VSPQQERCRWIINAPGRMTPLVECGAPATHYCPESGSQYCRQHSEDYADVFGDESLKEFPMSEESQ